MYCPLNGCACNLVHKIHVLMSNTKPKEVMCAESMCIPQYTLVYYSYFKQFSIKCKEHAAIASLVHKVNAPVGEPNRTVPTNVRPRNKSLTFSSETLEPPQSQLGTGQTDSFCCFNE